MDARQEGGVHGGGGTTRRSTATLHLLTRDVLEAPLAGDLGLGARWHDTC